jgi:hypothetical protein
MPVYCLQHGFHIDFENASVLFVAVFTVFRKFEMENPEYNVPGLWASRSAQQYSRGTRGLWPTA